MHNVKKNDALSRDYAGLLRFLALGPMVHPQSTQTLLILSANGTVQKLSATDMTLLATKGLIVRNAEQIWLTSAGHQLLATLGQRADVSIRSREIGSARQLVVVNDKESPLSALVRRKAADGSSFLNAQEYDAGERIREDFTRGMLMPRTSANWQASVSGGRRAGDENGIENLTTSALAARMRFDNAMKGLGQDLAGVIADICCFLKGFEQVEAERGWPKRSAKFLLKAGLAVLANHYWPRQPHDKVKTRQWGADDYRPTIR